MSRLPGERQRKILAEHEGGKITLKDVESSWKEFRLDESALDLPGIDIDTAEDSNDPIGIQAASDLIRDFEILVSKMTSLKPMPAEIQKAVDLQRQYLKESFANLKVLVKTVA